MSNKGGVRAWQFLRRNPAYVEAWRRVETAAPVEPAPFPLRKQTEADSAAAEWGLLAWEDPLAEDGPASPFWAEAEMLDASPAQDAPPLSELLKAPDCRLWGLRLRSGAVIVKVEEGERAVQLRIVDGDTFDPAGGIALRLPVGLDLRLRLRRAADLWPLGSRGKKRPSGGACPTASFSWLSTVTFPARRRARSRESFGIPRRWRLSGMRTADSGPWCAGASTARSPLWKAATATC